MKLADLENIIRNHSLKSTPSRVDILKVLAEKNKVLMLPDINKYLKNKAIDRITLYRTLNIFQEQGIIHKVPDANGGIGYALCKHERINHSHQDDHVHFKCNNCQTLVCLEKIEIPRIKLPRKYKSEKLNFLVEGICDKCS
jgi:Fur family ferric uptake transcriptional regulator